MSKEDELQKEFIVEAERRGAHASDIESGLSAAGFPDVDLCMGGEISQVELKHYKMTKPIHRNAPEIRPTQVKWMRERVRAGGHPVFLSKLLTKDGIIFALHHGRYAEELAMCKSCEEMLDEPCITWKGEINWSHLFSELENKESLLDI